MKKIFVSMIKHKDFRATLKSFLIVSGLFIGTSSVFARNAIVIPERGAHPGEGGGSGTQVEIEDQLPIADDLGTFFEENQIDSADVIQVYVLQGKVRIKGRKNSRRYFVDKEEVFFSNDEIRDLFASRKGKKIQVLGAVFPGDEKYWVLYIY